MKKIVFIIIFSFFLIGFVSAQIVYISSHKTSSGLMIGIEIFDKEKGFSLKPSNYSYEWKLAGPPSESLKTKTNILSLSQAQLEKALFLDIKIIDTSNKKTYFFKNKKISLSEPRVKIVRKTSDGLTLPFIGKLKQNESLSVITENFASKKITYVWELNEVFLSNEKEISVDDLKEKSGIIKVKVFGEELKEKAEDLQRIKIE
jgi:hypothetical protein